LDDQFKWRLFGQLGQPDGWPGQFKPSEQGDRKPSRNNPSMEGWHRESSLVNAAIWSYSASGLIARALDADRLVLLTPLELVSQRAWQYARPAQP